MRDYRFHGFTRDGAGSFADVLREDGFTMVEVLPSDGRTPGWGVHGMADERSEGLLETLAQFFGGAYDGDGMARG